MPHQCTNCDRTFPDGSKEMLSGCPDCGGNKFRYLPSSDGPTSAGEDAPADSPAESPPSPDRTGGSVANAVRGATTTVREWVDRGGGDPAPDRRPGEDPAPDRPAGATGDEGTADADGSPVPEAGEDAAQASARSSVVGPDELPGRSSGPDGSPPESDGPAPSEWPTPEPDDATSPPVDPDAPPTDADASADPSPAVDPPGDDGSAVDPPGDDGPSTRDLSSGVDSPGTPSSGVDSPGEDASPPDGPSPDGDPGRPADAVGDRPTADEGSPGIAELRQELDDQFESIKIVEPGQYELNLMELYDREEYIISLMEDGRYAIEVPETWRDGDP